MYIGHVFLLFAIVKDRDLSKTAFGSLAVFGFANVERMISARLPLRAAESSIC